MSANVTFDDNIWYQIRLTNTGDDQAVLGSALVNGDGDSGIVAQWTLSEDQEENARRWQVFRYDEEHFVLRTKASGPIGVMSVFLDTALDRTAPLMKKLNSEPNVLEDGMLWDIISSGGENGPFAFSSKANGSDYRLQVQEGENGLMSLSSDSSRAEDWQSFNFRELEEINDRSYSTFAVRTCESCQKYGALLTSIYVGLATTYFGNVHRFCQLDVLDCFRFIYPHTNKTPYPTNYNSATTPTLSPSASMDPDTGNPENSASPSTSPSPSGGLSAGAAAGIGVSVGIVFILAIVGAFYLWRRRKRQSKGSPALGDNQTNPATMDYYGKANTEGPVHWQGANNTPGQWQYPPPVEMPVRTPVEMESPRNH